MEKHKKLSDGHVVQDQIVETGQRSPESGGAPPPLRTHMVVGKSGYVEKRQKRPKD